MLPDQQTSYQLRDLCSDEWYPSEKHFPRSLATTLFRDPTSIRDERETIPDPVGNREVIKHTRRGVHRRLALVPSPEGRCLRAVHPCLWLHNTDSRRAGDDSPWFPSRDAE